MSTYLLTHRLLGWRQWHGLLLPQCKFPQNGLLWWHKLYGGCILVPPYESVPRAGAPHVTLLTDIGAAYYTALLMLTLYEALIKRNWVELYQNSYLL